MAPSQEEQQRKASYDLAAARLVKMVLFLLCFENCFENRIKGIGFEDLFKM